jgi:hypothetical protein
VTHLWDAGNVVGQGFLERFGVDLGGLDYVDGRAAQAQLRCPRLCFAGSADQVTYDERWGGVRVDMAGPVISRRAEREALGWEVRVLEGPDHLQAMQAAQVLPILRPWLVSEAATGS